MHRSVQIGSAILVITTAAVVMLGLGIFEYRRGRNSSELLYTRSVKKHDVVDAARNALAALSDAELREQDYVLTGETVYSEAYIEDIRQWQDELAALELVARNDPATPLVQDLSKAGTLTMSELALVVSLYDKTGRDAALERIRKSSGIVYLDHARDSVAKILEVDGGGADLTNRIVTRSLLSLRRLAEAIVALFLLTVTGALLLMLEVRRRR